MAALIAAGCYWGEVEHIPLWVKCLQRIANPPGGRAGVVAWINLRMYPALLILFAGGIASVARGRYDALAALLLRVRVRGNQSEHPLALRARPGNVIDVKSGQYLPGMERRYTPVSERFFQVLRNQLKDFLPDDVEYERHFDRFEYMFALVEADLAEKEGWGHQGFTGRFSWKGMEYESYPPV